MSKLDILVKQINKQYKEDIASRGIPVRHFEKIKFSFDEMIAINSVASILDVLEKKK